MVASHGFASRPGKQVLAACYFDSRHQGGFTIWVLGLFAFLIAILLLLAWVFCCRYDEIRFANGTADGNAVLVDASSGSPPWNDKDFLGLDSQNISLQANVSGTGEIIGFSHGRRPTLLEAVDWGSGAKTVTFTFENELVIPIDIWIVKGPYNPQDNAEYAQPNHALLSVYDTNELIWRPEAAGLVLDAYIHNATGDPDASDFYNFTCADAVTTIVDPYTGAEPPNTNNIQHKIGYISNRINVYFVDTVDGSRTAGVHCGNSGRYHDWGLIAMASETRTHLLAHEIGHALSLGHVNTNYNSCEDVSPVPGFNEYNVMHDCTVDRRFLTEGQTYRQVINPTSAIERLYHQRQAMRASRASLDCPAFFAGDTNHPRYSICPTLGRRLWADGALAPGP